MTIAVCERTDLSIQFHCLTKGVLGAKLRSKYYHYPNILYSMYPIHNPEQL